MAKTRRKKKPVYKKPAFWVAVIAVVLVIVLVAWVAAVLRSSGPLIRKPDPTTVPTSQERPTEDTQETLPPPEANP